ncbi:hypothetical protein C8A01DRAFT_39076 [Parachaetomium inaequale]|uniref:Uncharacterized protein n=1 Tax=Parachaetomium inaequale TaxID=2588326 RepID=A0AAN6PDQ4_9PEZI|nr:hypothetical protein C8A01DRAFT_39076 [Parachaetomium inaequale]
MAQQLTNRDFREAFLRGSITPWRHKDYVRAAYLTLLEQDNKDMGLLEVATKFAANVHSFKQRNSQFQLQPESRTLTVFWLYHVKLAITAMRVYQQRYRELAHFKRIFHYLPELIDEKMATAYYSSDILKSEYAEKFWILPNLRDLVEPLRHPDLKFRGQFTKKEQEDPERLVRFAFSVVQRYLRPGETRRRACFINLAFGALQQQTTRLRSFHPWLSAHSETRCYFYIQLVHAALSQLITTGKIELVQVMSYPLFRETFGILPSAWTTYYSPQLWDSLKARANFVPPDLKPLPDCIHPPNYRLEPFLPDPNEPFRKLGFIPELPSLEVLHFHQAVLLEDAKPLPPTLTPSEVTSHAHLLKYIHTHLILPSPDLTYHLTHHLALLTTTSPLPTAHITYYLHVLHTTTGEFIRHHNCPCHRALELPYEIGPDAVLYPKDPPYEHPSRLTHACRCHTGEALDLDGFAALCAEDLRKREEDVKRRRGEVFPGGGWGRGKGDGKAVEWGEWVRGEGGLVLCWDEAWKGGRGEELEGVWGEVEGGAVEGREVEGGEGDEGEGEDEYRTDTDMDEKTLGGEKEEDEDWDVVSQATL